MTCRQAFDFAWGCQSVAGQWNSVYRYGTVRDCSELWSDFWFCMRTRSYGPELRAEAVREHYRQKQLQKYGPGMPSSEDVWASRETKVQPGSVFNMSVD